LSISSNLFAVLSGYKTLKQGPNLGYRPKNGVIVGLYDPKHTLNQSINQSINQSSLILTLFLCSSQMVHSPNGTFAKWFIRQMVHSPNSTQAFAASENNFLAVYSTKHQVFYLSSLVCCALLQSRV
jgi:hypothetical protein